MFKIIAGMPTTPLKISTTYQRQAQPVLNKETETVLQQSIQKAYTNKALEKTAALQLLENCRQDIGIRMKNTDSTKENARLNERQSEFSKIKDAVESNTIELIGIVGWGKDCLDPGSYTKNGIFNISQHHALIYRKNGEIRVEELGSAMTLFGEAPVKEKIKSPEIIAYPAEEKQAPITKGHLYETKQNGTIDRGLYFSNSENGPRCIIESPVKNVLMFSIHCYGEDSKPIRCLDLKDKPEPLKKSLKSKISNLRFLNITNAVLDEKNEKGILHVQIVLSENANEEFEKLQNIIRLGVGELNKVSGFKPNRSLFLMGAMCNGGCTRKANSILNNGKEENWTAQAVYFSEQIGSTNKRNENEERINKIGLLYLNPDHQSKIPEKILNDILELPIKERLL